MSKAEYTHQWYMANRERVLAHQREYDKAHPEKRRAQRRAYRLANAAKIRESQRAWWAAHPDYQREYRKKKRGNL